MTTAETIAETFEHVANSLQAILDGNKYRDMRINELEARIKELEAEALLRRAVS